MSTMRVKCTVCGRESSPDHGRALQAGWPTCCGYTMRLESTKEFIDAIESGPSPFAGAQRRLSTEFASPGTDKERE